MVGNAHLDLVWLWKWQEGFQENKATFLSALERMKEYDDFVFTSSSAQLYEWLEKNNPTMFGEIKARIKEGRWTLCGGWWVEPDCNVPGGEAYAHSSLISQNYFRDKFGVTAKAGYCIDSFGHNGMLPQILKLSGMDSYVFMRPMEHEKSIADRAFIWEGVDGSKVCAYRIPFGYGCAKEFPEQLQKYREEFTDRVDRLMFFYGVGNHGGGPTIENIEAVKKLQKENPDLEIVFSDPNTYFEELDKGRLMTVRGELQHHSPGCYSAQSMIKKYNRLAENTLLSAEKMSVVAEMLGYDVPDERLTDGWKKLLLNQFHDTLAGSAIEDAYRESRDQLGEAVSIGSDCVNYAVQSMSYDIDIPYDSSTLPMVVFNPNSFEASAPVEFENGLFSNYADFDNLIVTDCDGNEVPVQFIQPGCRVPNRRRICYMAKVPPLGYKVYFVRMGNGSSHGESPELNTEDPYVLENDFIRVRIDEHRGTIASIYDKMANREVLKEVSSFMVINDDNDTWGHSLKSLDQAVGEFHLVHIRVLDDGPVRKQVRVISEYGHSSLTQDICLYRDSAKIYLNVKVNWNEHRKALKMYFEPNLAYDAKAVSEIPFGCIEKQKNGLEECMQRFVDLSDGGYGLSIINDCKYGVDFRENRIGITILRSPVYSHHEPYELSAEEDEEYSYMDQGIQEMQFILKPHGGSWEDAGTVQDAALLNQPLIATYETFHKGSRPLQNQFIEIDNSSVILSALKKPLKRKGIILRVYESSGRPEVAKICFAGRSADVSLHPYEIRTLLLDESGFRTVNLIEDDV